MAMRNWEAAEDDVCCVLRDGDSGFEVCIEGIFSDDVKALRDQIVREHNLLEVMAEALERVIGARFAELSTDAQERAYKNACEVLKTYYAHCDGDV